MPERSFCDDRSLRNLHFGTLGPEAVGITVDGRRVPLAAPEGAYLLVRRPPASMRSSVQGGGSPWPDNGPITAIHYRDGSTCEVTVRGPEQPCKMPGYVAPARPDVTPRDLPVSVRLRQGRSGRWTATVRFTAPVAVTDASSHYEIRLTPPPRKTRGWSHMILPTDRNIAQGENRQRAVHEPARQGALPRCRHLRARTGAGWHEDRALQLPDPVSLARFSGVDGSCSSALTVSVISRTPIGSPRVGRRSGPIFGA